MTDAEFVSEVRRGLITIMRALIRRYGLAWVDFLPREEQPLPPAPLKTQVKSEMPVFDIAAR